MIGFDINIYIKCAGVCYVDIDLQYLRSLHFLFYCFDH